MNDRKSAKIITWLRRVGGGVSSRDDKTDDWPLDAGGECEGDVILLTKPFGKHKGNCFVAHIPGLESISDDGKHTTSFIELEEDGVRLQPHTIIDAIVANGQGGFSHYGKNLYFSSSDNTNPNDNGRKYTVRRPAVEMETYLRLVNLKRYLHFTKNNLGAWGLHPNGSIAQKYEGGNIPPPIYCNLIGLTSHCNLRCSICGSQEAIDHEGTQRRSMPQDVLNSVADTVFPFVSTVILASLGEPLIYPHIGIVLDKAFKYGCTIKLESNGTALSPKRIKQLCRLKSELFFSIDATGELFNEMRMGADWMKVDSNIRMLMHARNPGLTKVKLYPTVSKKTLPDMLNIVRWAVDVGVNEIDFHSYDPTMFAKEQRPSPDEYKPMIESIQSWLGESVGDRAIMGISVKADGVELNSKYGSHTYELPGLPLNNPIREDLYEKSGFMCKVPLQHIEVGFDGQIYPCVWAGARPQENTVGMATSLVEFISTWFGPRYRQLRASLRTGSAIPKAVAQCDACIRRYSSMGTHTESKQL